MKEKWYAALREHYDGERVNLVFLFDLEELLKARHLHKEGRLVEAQEALDDAVAGLYVDDNAFYRTLEERFEGRYEGVLEGEPEEAGAETEPVSFWAEFPAASKPHLFRFYANFKWWTLNGSDTITKEIVLDLEDGCLEMEGLEKAKP